MAAVTITDANFLPSARARVKRGVAGESISARGKAVYFDSTTSTYKLAQCDGTSAESNCVGLSAHPASTGQPIEIVEYDPELTIGGTVAVGSYCLGTGAGGIVPEADLASTNYVTHLGVAISTTKLFLDPKPTLAAKA